MSKHAANRSTIPKRCRLVYNQLYWALDGFVIVDQWFAQELGGGAGSIHHVWCLAYWKKVQVDEPFHHIWKWIYSGWAVSVFHLSIQYTVHYSYTWTRWCMVGWPIRLSKTFLGFGRPIEKESCWFSMSLEPFDGVMNPFSLNCRFTPHIYVCVYNIYIYIYIYT